MLAATVVVVAAIVDGGIDKVVDISGCCRLVDVDEDDGNLISVVLTLS